MSVGNASQFLSSLPVSSIIQAVGNINDPSWMRCDNSIITRALYQAFSTAMPGVGTFTSTLRSTVTGGALGGAGQLLATNGTVIVGMGGVSGTSALIYSLNNGVSWNTTTHPNLNNPFGVVYNGTVFVATPQGANPSPIYAANPAGPWSTAGGTATPVGQLVANPAGTVIAGGYSWGALAISTNAAAPSFSTISGIAGAPYSCGSPIIWSGSQFMLFGVTGIGCGGVQSSPTGASGTWTSSFGAPWGQSNITGACSDGAGNVLAVIAGSSIAWVSNNSGANWRSVLLPCPAATNCCYTNGRWIVPCFVVENGQGLQNGAASMSADLNTWFLVPAFMTPGVANQSYASATVYLGGNYVTATTASLGAAQIVTSTENTAQMYLPSSRRASTTAAGANHMYSVANNQEWVKVA